MKNIAIIVQKLCGGGAERTASNLSILLSKDYNVHLIVFDADSIKYPYAGQLHDLKIPPVKTKTGKALNVFKRVSRIRDIKKKYNIDASISFMEGANLVNVLSRYKDKVIISVRNQMSLLISMGARGKLFDKQIRFNNRKADLVVSLSDGVKKDLIEVFNVPANKVVTIYNPCDGALLREKASAHKDEASRMPENSMVTMGRLNQQKGQWHLVRAFKNVVETVPDAKLYIFGQGELEAKLKTITKELGLTDHVEFMGFREAPHAFIANAKAFVFPSVVEGLGNVLLEALACGTLCIASDCYSGPREILAPGTDVKETLSEPEYAAYGVLVSVCGTGNFNSTDPLTREELQLADAIKKMYRDSQLRSDYAKKAIERSANFSPETIAAEWKKIL